MIIDRILGDRVLVRLLDAPKVTRSGIIIPDRSSHLQPRHGVVESVGFLLTPDGTYKKCLRVELNEIVLLPAHGRGGLEIDADGSRLWVFDSSDLLAVVKDTDYVRADEGRGSSPAGELGVSG